MARSVSGLIVEMSANTAKLQTDMARATSMIEGFSNKAVAALKGVAIAAAGTFVFQNLVLGLKQATDAMDKLNESSQKLGISVEGLQVWHMAARKSGIELDVMEKAIGRLAKNAYLAEDSFREIGIATTGADGKLKTVDVLLGEISDKFSKMDDGTRKTALALELFGRTGADLIPTLNRGTAELEELKKQMGYIASAEDTARADAFNDTLDILARRSEGLKMALMGGMLPALQSLTESLMQTSNTGEAFANIGKYIGEVMLQLTRIGMGVAGAFDVVGTTIGRAAARLGDFSRAYTVGGLAGMWKVLTGGNQPVVATDKMEEWGKRISGLGAGSISNPFLKTKKMFSGGAAKSITGGAGGKSEIDQLAKEIEKFRDAIEKTGPSLDTYDNKIWELAETCQKLVDKGADLREMTDLLREGIANIEMDRLADAQKKWNDELAQTLGLFDPLTTKINNIRSQAEALIALGADEMETLEQMYQMIDALEATRESYDKVKDKAKETANLTTELFSKATSAIEDMFVNMATGAEMSFESMANAIIADLTRIAYKMAIYGNASGTYSEEQGIAGGIIKGLGALFGGMGSETSTTSGSSADYLMGYAKGGVVNSPKIFPMANGMGLMGEAGSEAVLPLVRGPNGDLGVGSNGGGGGNYIYINAADSKSFLDMCRRNPGAIIEPITKAMQNNQDLRNTMRRTR